MGVINDRQPRRLHWKPVGTIMMNTRSLLPTAHFPFSKFIVIVRSKALKIEISLFHGLTTISFKIVEFVSNYDL